ncbi:hypothetical protein DL767_001155 [Monosporascus sp. MG133]|nr:hypothetical protein DL767_001155 [Monosporascus sp. MG133]
MPKDRSTQTLSTPAVRHGSGNTKGSISSHRKTHDPNPAYNRGAVKFQQPIPCRAERPLQAETPPITETFPINITRGTPRMPRDQGRRHCLGHTLDQQHNMLRHYGSQHGYKSPLSGIPKANGQRCGTEIANTKGSISSHRKIHDPNSAYNREAVKEQTSSYHHLDQFPITIQSQQWPQRPRLSKIGARLSVTSLGRKGIDARSPKANGHPRDTEIANTKGSISSHRKIHDPNSTYNREAVKFPQPVLCQETKADGADTKPSKSSHKRVHDPIFLSSTGCPDSSHSRDAAKFAAPIAWQEAVAGGGFCGSEMDCRHNMLLICSEDRTGAEMLQGTTDHAITIGLKVAPSPQRSQSWFPCGLPADNDTADDAPSTQQYAGPSVVYTPLTEGAVWQAEKGGKEYDGHYTNDATTCFCDVRKKTISAERLSIPSFPLTNKHDPNSAFAQKGGNQPPVQCGEPGFALDKEKE